MKSRSKIVSLATALGISAVMGFGVSAANAEVSDGVDQAIVLAALENLGADAITPELAEELTSGIDAATDANLVNQEIIDAITEVVVDPETNPGAEPTTEPSTAPATDPATDPATEPVDVIEVPADLTDATEGLLDEQLANDQELWDSISAAWQAAFETVRADFEACRAEGADTSACARPLGFQMQVAHANAVLAAIDARAAEIAELPEDERAAALAELETLRASVEARLVRAEEKLANATTPANARAAVDVAAALGAARGFAAVTRGAGAESASNAVTPAEPGAVSSQGQASQGQPSQGASRAAEQRASTPQVTPRASTGQPAAPQGQQPSGTQSPGKPAENPGKAKENPGQGKKPE